MKKMYDPSTPLGSCFQFSSLSCFSHPWLNKTNAHAFCSSFGYRYYSTRCWLVRHQLLTTNRWNKILRIHSGYDLSSGAVCRFCDSFLDSGHKIDTIIPGKKALTALRKTSVNKNSRTSSQDLNENFTQSSKKDLIEGIWQDLCTRTSWRLPLQTFIQAPSRSSRKNLLEDSSRMCARSPHKHLYNKGFH